MSKLVTHLRPTDPFIDPELVAIVKNLLIRVQAGVTIGLGVIEHQIGDEVVIEARGAGSYHELNSGAARLAHMLAGMKGEDL